MQTHGHTISLRHGRPEILAGSGLNQKPLWRNLVYSFPKRTLGVKVGGLAALLLLGLLAVGAYSVWQIRSIGDELDDLVRNDLAISSSLRVVERNTSARRNSLNEMALLGAQDRFDDVRSHSQAVADNSSEISRNLLLIRDTLSADAGSTNDESSKRFREFVRFLSQAEVIEAEISTLALQYGEAVIKGDTLLTAPALLRLLNRSDALDQTILLMDNELQRLIPESAASAQDRQRTATTATIIVAIVALILGGLSSAVLVRRLTFSIQSVASRAREIERTIDTEDFSHREVPIESTDEVGDLAIAVNEMSLNIANNLEVRRQYEDELTAARDQAVQANRAKSDFLANMSHELRTPLNAIIGYSEMLQEEAEDLDQDSMVPDLQRINVAGHHLLTLINDVLDLSKIEAGRMEVFVEEFDLGAMSKEVLSVIQPLVAKNGNRLEQEILPGPGMMHADATKVRQALFNLLSNAAKFTIDGLVRLEARAIERKGTAWVELTVRDSGIGMTDQQLEKIFTEFTQADASISSRFGGTGLGLTITERNCRLMGGEIVVESGQGEGSSFSIRLPRDVRPFVHPDLMA